MFTTAFLKGSGERAIKTFAQTLLGILGVTGIGFGDVDWVASLSVAALAGIASILTSIVNPSFTAGPDTQEVYDPTAAIITEDGETPNGDATGDQILAYDGDPATLEATETEADRVPASEPDATPVAADYVPRHSA